MKYSLAIFDLDGTILETLEDLADGINHVLKKYNFPVHDYEKVKYMVGNGIAKLVERAVPDGLNNPEYKAVYEDFVEYYRLHCTEKTGPYEGMVDCLKTLKAAGVKLAVNTNKDETAAVKLMEDYFPGIFDTVCGGKTGVPVKPAPDGVHEIWKRLGFSEEQAKGAGGAVFIGDSDVDIATGLNAGIPAVGCEWGFRGREFLLEHGAKVTVSKPEDLVEMILG